MDSLMTCPKCGTEGQRPGFACTACGDGQEAATTHSPPARQFALSGISGTPTGDCNTCPRTGTGEASACGKKESC